MPRIPLLGGAYKQAALIAGAQRAINLYAEKATATAQAPVNVTHYPRPGLTLLGAPPTPNLGRGLYVSTLGDLYAFIGQIVYWVSPDWTFTPLGQLLIPATTPVYAADNGQNAIVVDGSSFGQQIQLAAGQPGVMTVVSDQNFMGADRVDFLDYFLIFNQPGTPNWYCTEESSTVFNALFFGTKTAWPDNVVTLIASERQAWIFGKYKAEVWNNAGLIPFPFQILSGNIVEHGCASRYAIGRQDVNIYWLSQSPEGARMAMRGAMLQAQRISNHAIEQEWLTYPKVDDCIVQTYQIRGHAFVEYHFPTADRTWVFDEATQEWHEKAWYDINGVQHRSRDTFKAFAYGKNVALDWNNGLLYQVDELNVSDNGVPIVFKRAMPHLVDDGEFDRLTLWRVIADMQCGVGPGVENPAANPPELTFRISRDRGASFETHSVVPFGGQGEYNNKPTAFRCGVAYDFVVELSWQGPMRSALNGVFAVIEKHEADE